MIGTKLKTKPSYRQTIAELLFSIFTGTVFIALITGIHILNPTENAWLTNGGDLEQQYLGWEFYRNEPSLQMPLGRLYSLGQGMAKSIIFTDSIPLVAIPAKYIFSYSGELLQTTGIWMLASTSLMHFYGCRCLRALGMPMRSARILGLAFMTSPVFLNRFHGNHGIAAHLGQWIILATLLQVISKEPSKKPWLLVNTFSLLINIYLFAMTMAITLFSKEGRNSLKNPMCLAALTLGALLSGYVDVRDILASANYASQGTYGTFKWNTLSMFNPFPDWSFVIKDLWVVNNGEYEGFSYLGLITLLGLLACIAQMTRLSRAILVKRLAPLLPALLPCGLMALFAMTLSIGIGATEFSLSGLPWPLSVIGNTFRASGRFIWPLCYLITIASLTGLHLLLEKVLAPRFLTIALAAAIATSVLDTGKSLARIKTAHSQSGAIILSKLIGNELHNRDVKQVLLENTSNSPENWPNLLKLALFNKASINTGYFARYEASRLAQLNYKTSQALASNSLETNTIYLIHPTREHLYSLSHLPNCASAKPKQSCETRYEGYKLVYSGSENKSKSNLKP